MRESIGNTFIVNIVITISVIIMLLLVASLSYSKAFKVKNNIINKIEEYGKFNQNTIDDVAIDLAKMGYRLNTNYAKCPKKNGQSSLYGNTKGEYHYCIYMYDITKGYYYEVVTYMHFDIPIVGDYIAIPVKGESRLFYSGID